VTGRNIAARNAKPWKKRPTSTANVAILAAGAAPPDGNENDSKQSVILDQSLALARTRDVAPYFHVILLARLAMKPVEATPEIDQPKEIPIRALIGQTN
jgi:hypothetical protein